MNNYIQQATEEQSRKAEESMSIDELLEHCQDNPIPVSDAVNYLLAAVEHFGTRTVFENGEEKERYCFFDDPYGNGEHAILGNTETLNSFVSELRRRASEEGENDKIIWFLGPTATGKSELKRCLINGLKGFAESEEGAKYTLEWTLDEYSADARMSYGDGTGVAKDYYKSPVNTNPLLLLPEETREKFVSDVDEDIEVRGRLDPFSREAMSLLEDDVDSFEEIVNGEFVQAKRYYPEVGDGIGVLHSEDSGNPKQKLVGSWMEGAMQKFAKRGQKNPQAFSYDGVLSQGNGLISIVEDAGHHSDVLDKMLNVCEEEMVKLDNKISMDIDTIIAIFSNPDLEGQLSEYSSEIQEDPLRALRRRLDKYEFSYLTTIGIEGLLIKRLLQDGSFIWDGEEDRMKKVAEPMELYGSEIAPRTVEAAAMYEMVTRLDDFHSSWDRTDMAMLLEGDKVLSPQGEWVSAEDYDMDYDEVGGKQGVPVTFTVDAIVELCHSEDVVLPQDVITRMVNNMDSEPMFDSEERKDFTNLVIDVDEYILDKQAEDVLEAMVGDVEVTEEDVREYVDGVLAWKENEDDKYDAYELMEFEKRYLGQPDRDYMDSATPSGAIVNFRQEIIAPINRYMWKHRDEDYKVDDVPLSESPSLEPLLEDNDWDTVTRVFPEADLEQWERPPEDTETEELKEKTIERMKELFAYSDESAEEVSQRVIEAVESIDGVFANDGT
jgi:predicted Ser/Thr protein kinase